MRINMDKKSDLEKEQAELFKLCQKYNAFLVVIRTNFDRAIAFFVPS